MDGGIIFLIFVLEQCYVAFRIIIGSSVNGLYPVACFRNLSDLQSVMELIWKREQKISNEHCFRLVMEAQLKEVAER